VSVYTPLLITARVRSTVHLKGRHDVRRTPPHTHTHGNRRYHRHAPLRQGRTTPARTPVRRSNRPVGRNVPRRITKSRPISRALFVRPVERGVLNAFYAYTNGEIRFRNTFDHRAFVFTNSVFFFTIWADYVNSSSVYFVCAGTLHGIRTRGRSPIRSWSTVRNGRR